MYSNSLIKLQGFHAAFGEITTSQVDDLFIALAMKYDVFTSDDEENKIEEIDTNIAPEIVLSEPFIQ